MQLVPAELPAASGASGAFTVRLSGVSAPACPTHGPQLGALAGGGAFQVISSLFARRAIPTAKAAGFFRRTNRCGSCGRSLAEVATQPGRLESAVPAPQAPRLAVAIEGPLLVCPGCGTRQLSMDGGTMRSVGSALAEALGELGLMP